MYIYIYILIILGSTLFKPGIHSRLKHTTKTVQSMIKMNLIFCRVIRNRTIGTLTFYSSEDIPRCLIYLSVQIINSRLLKHVFISKKIYSFYAFVYRLHVNDEKLNVFSQG